MELSEEDLLQKHRKERKDLQVKITTIKKTADKKKKKESAELIAKLEAELKNKQQIELDSLTNSLKSFNCNEDAAPSISPPGLEEPKPSAVERVSKAQRRRNKKTNNEIENQRKIAEQEIENESGPRNVESLAIKKLLEARGLYLQEIPSDGDCLYQAISHQLKTTGKQPILSVAELRTETSVYMKDHKNDMLPFLITEDGDVMTDDGYEEYCNRVASTKTWGGQIELTALAEILKCPIHVIQATSPTTILGEGFTTEPLIITYHRHMYGLGEHYNSTNIGVEEQDETF